MPASTPPPKEPKKKKPEWPANYPPGCPDATTRPVDGDIFRLVNGTSKDWESAEQQGTFTNRPQCERVSLSVFRVFKHIVVFRKINRALFGEHSIARASLRPEHGMVKRTFTAKGHHSLWLRASARERCDKLFSVVPE